MVANKCINYYYRGVDNGQRVTYVYVVGYGARVNPEYADAYSSTSVDKIDLHIPSELLDEAPESMETTELAEPKADPGQQDGAPSSEGPPGEDRETMACEEGAASVEEEA